MESDQAQALETADLVDLLFTVMPMVADHITVRLEGTGLGATDYWALRSIEGPMPMKELATCMEVDPSYVTLVADRLEGLGLIERQPHPTDRRVKNLVLTPKGEEFRASLPVKLWSGLSVFSALGEGERAQLMGLLEKTVARPEGLG